ncbi:MAG: hypothetical protein HY321_02770 [Armatimonadetes bacterium]|nr:hypothetical protein [Armatimonadota bacterium]
MSQDDLLDPEDEPTDLLAGVIDPDHVLVQVAPDDDPDAETAAAAKVMMRIDEVYAAGQPGTTILCPFCGRSLRYRKDEYGRLAECPGEDFVAIG